ncbi:MAG: DUF2934 domain-containing protein [Candidatus Omnitrophica bacterium]|nr:DUF2934 domain-containing protein [Candidatus Omnitrophota bacterium]
MVKHPPKKTPPTNRVRSASGEDFEEKYSQEAKPSFEEIQKLAYHIHLEKGGSELENWIEAEKTLKEQRPAGSSR